MALEFITAVKAEVEHEEDSGIELHVGYRDEHDKIQQERLVRAYRPKDGMVTLTMAQMGRHSKTTDKVSGIVDLFLACFKEDDRQYFIDRLYEPEDPFGIDEITPMMTGLLEEWAGRPTK